MDASIPTADVEAHIQGEISGQVAVGNYNLQIGSVHGGVVNVVAPGRQTRPRARPTPVLLRPRPFAQLLDRETEVRSAESALRAALTVEFSGQSGIGKTVLLRHLAHQPLAETLLPDGVIYLSGRQRSLADLLQSLYDALYESDVPYKPTDTQLHHDLQDKRALVIVDDLDAELARDEIEALLNAAPGCVFLLASTQRKLWGEGRALALGGLPPEQAALLVERELGRPLSAEEQSAARSLSTALEGHPLRLLQAAAVAREEGRSLQEIAQRAQAIPADEALSEPTAASLSNQERQTLSLLAALKGASLDAGHVAALTGLRDAASLLESLRERGLVEAHSPRYSLRETLAQAPAWRETLDPGRWAARALTYFANWAETRRLIPERLLEEAGAILQLLRWGADAGHRVEVLRLGKAVEEALALDRRWGAWEEVLQLLRRVARDLGDRVSEAWALHQLGTRALCLENTATARSQLIQALRMRESLGDRVGAAVTRHNLNILLGPPPPPRRPPEPAPAPAGGILAALDLPLLLVLALALLALVPLSRRVWESIPGVATKSPTAVPVARTTLTPSPVLTPTPTFIPSVTPTTLPFITVTPIPPRPTFTPWPCADSAPLDWRLYTVQGGDTLFALSRRHGTTVEAIIFYNCLQSTGIQAGQRLYLPSLPTPTGTDTPTPETPTPTPETPTPTPETPTPIDYPIVTLSPADLTTILETTEPATVNAEGQSVVPIRVVVTNRGESEAGTFKVSLVYASLRQGEASGTPPLPVEVSIFPFLDTTLAPGESASWIGTLVLPPGFQDQTVRLVAQADSCWGEKGMPEYCRVEESDEGNNLSREITVSLPGEPVRTPGFVDLIVYTFSGPPTLAYGQEFSEGLALSVTNRGNTESDEFLAVLFLSTDTVDGDDTVLSRVSVPPVAPGQVVEVNWTDVRMPESWAQDFGYLGVVLDPSDSQPESDKTNNTAYVPVKIESAPY